ncbi:Centromere protein K [Myotis davidii]|uniref:Centromere protein K n=1 Tax=Myotis davidii TaxID=225400 RepID=L5LXQ5_MYODS|nr:Centromere protein K [Myotis davidii]
MSMSNQDLDPDSTTDEDITTAKEELIKKCEEMWKDLEELSLLIMQVKCLTAELSQWQKETPEILPLSEEVLVTLGKEEILLNRLFDVPHDPYVKISDSFWPPYIELLLRNGIALRHPEDPSQIRLEAFHQ